MKRLFFLLFFIPSIGYSQTDIAAFKQGELLKYKLSYGPINAGFATLEIEDHFENDKKMFHVIGKGWTTGMTEFFFPVRDNYQTYFDKSNMQPYRFIRKIDEGGYTKDKEIFFDFRSNIATVIDHKKNTEKTFSIHSKVQDMLSSLYYLRTINFNTLKEGDVIGIDMFLDNEIHKLYLIFKAREIIKFNNKKIKTLVLQPTVQEGRIFKSNESVTFWISDDMNKIPIKIKASILVGSIKAELVEYKGLANPMPLIFN
ncbi:MAG: DUF3108 domain-containing protein [Flavobacteriaceae bacterium]|nr:DUF3108 domain-containing protein [Flavobacteriaceae bacterium]